MKPEYFFIAVIAVGLVVIVYNVIAYRRDKASLGETSSVQKDNDWLYFGIAMLVLLISVCGLIYSAHTSYKKEQESLVENLRTEEFSYKGHQYIKFETNRTFDGMSVVHDPNCECLLKKDSI